MQRSARIEIDLEALTHNLSVVRQYANNAKIIAVIKANAYGHGMLAIAQQLENKVDALAVACVDEALVLRANGIKSKLVVLQGFHNEQELNQCFLQQLEPVCHQTWQVDLLSEYTTSEAINCWLKIDSGMHRLGVSTAHVAGCIQQLSHSSCVNELRLMSHFSNADNKDSVDNQQQLEVFNQCVAATERGSGIETSMANSAAILSNPDAIKDWVRPGLMLYGVSPFADQSASEFGLKPVMTLTSRVIAINEVASGESIGYGNTWTSSRLSKIATVAIGYGDGYSRHAENGVPVIVKSQRCELVGQVSMDMITIDVTGVDVEIGDQVTLWGGQIAVEEVAKLSTTIAYELLCHAGKDQ